MTSFPALHKPRLIHEIVTKTPWSDLVFVHQWQYRLLQTGGADRKRKRKRSYNYIRYLVFPFADGIANLTSRVDDTHTNALF